MKKANLTITTITFFGGIALFIYGCFSKGFSVMIGLGLLISSISLLVKTGIYRKESKNDKEILYQHIYYDKKNQQLILRKRSNELNRLITERNLIVIKNDSNYTSHDTPTKLHFGAATVGGVTSGGVYTTGGQRVVDGHYGTGRCYLEYCEFLLDGRDSTKAHIQSIKLSPELLHDAKKSPAITNYLQNDCIIVECEAKMSLDEIKRAMQDLNSGYTQSRVKSGYPTRKKCEDIVNWIMMK